MKIEVKGARTWGTGDVTLTVDTLNEVRLTTHYSSSHRDQSTVFLTRDQALQLAGALQVLAWNLNDEKM